MTDRSPRTSQGRGFKGWLLIAGVVVLALFFALNLQKVEVDLIVTTVRMPLIFALAIAALLGMLIAWAVPRFRSNPRQ